ncbi:MAG: hypothetical protein ACLR3P_14000 [Hungatella sp.]|uniref:hypothetical protein n=1 Tax=Hungatella sp. TaxID=2613924 RepID=UPI0039A204D3
MIDDKRIEAAQAAVNKCRERDNEIVKPNDKMPWKREVVRQLKPGDKGYLPPVTDFVTLEFHNGFVVVPAEYFNKLSKAKKKKLMKF